MWPTPKTIDLGPTNPVAYEIWRDSLPLWPFVVGLILLFAILLVLILIYIELRLRRKATDSRFGMPVIPIERPSSERDTVRSVRA